MNILGLAFAEGGVFFLVDPGFAVGGCFFPGGAAAGCLNCEGVFLNISPAEHAVESSPRRLIRRARFLPGDGGEQLPLADSNVEGSSIPIFDATSPMFPSSCWGAGAAKLRTPSTPVVEESSVTVLGAIGFASNRSCEAGSSPTPPVGGESRLQSVARDEVTKRKSTKCHNESACSMMGFGRDEI